MPSRNAMDLQARQRIAAWLAWYRFTRWQLGTDAEMARALGIAPGTLSTLLSGKRTPGLDVFIRLHRVGGLSADLMLNTDPPTYAPAAPKVPTRKRRR